MLANPYMTKQAKPVPDSVLVESEPMNLDTALDLAIRALESKSETYVFGAKMVADRGEDAVPEAKKDAGRYSRLMAAVRLLRQHRAGIGK
jgi:predicted glycosyltransferase